MVRLIQAKQKHFNTIYHEAMDALFIIDASSRKIISYNKRTQELLHIPQEKDNKKLSLNDFFQTPYNEKQEAFLFQDLENKSIVYEETYFKTFKGESFKGILEIKPLEDFYLAKITRIVDVNEVEESFKTILAGTTLVGEGFLRNIGQLIHKTFKTRFALIGKITGEFNEKIQTLYFSIDGKTVDNFMYDLEGTPCSNVLNNRNSFYPRDLAKLFPKDKSLKTMGVESYWGTIIYDDERKPIGILNIMHNQTIEKIPHGDYILDVFACRIGAEIKRLETKEELRRKNIELQEAYKGTQEINEELLQTQEELENKLEEFVLYFMQQEKTVNELFFDLLEDPAPTSEFLQLIDQKILAGSNLEELASLSNMSLSTFKRKFKEEFGIPVGRFIRKRKLEIAKEKILSGMRGSDIYYELGYQNHSSFISAFKKEHGLTPEAYRGSLH